MNELLGFTDRLTAMHGRRSLVNRKGNACRERAARRAALIDTAHKVSALENAFSRDTQIISVMYSSALMLPLGGEG
jgi:hypothetical protein